MILIEPDAATSSNRSALKLRALRSFVFQAKAAVGLHGEVSAMLATDATIRTLNRDFRKKDKATDVLSFPIDPEHPGEGRKQAGDLAISLDTARKQAGEHGHDLQTEVKILLLHGMLHLAGYDHESDTGQMARKESALRKQFDLPAGLIQRSRIAAPAAKKRVSVKSKSSAAAKGRSRAAKSRSRAE